MGALMKRWSDEIHAASDEVARRELLGRIGVWRAGQLSDMVAQRQAAGAMARLHALLGNNEAATQEARALISLCQTTPAAPPADLKEAQALLHSLGGGKAIVGPQSSDREDRNRRERKPREERAPREERGPRAERAPREDRGGRADSRVSEAMRLARSGKWDDANKALVGGRGPSAQLARTWIRLAWALSAPDDHARVAGMREIESWLANQLERGGQADRAEAPAEKTREPKVREPRTESDVVTPHQLDEVLGQQTPKRWRERLDLLEAAVLGSPEDVDRIAALALDHHVAVSGDRSPAPWLANLVSQALTTTGQATRAVIQAMTKAGVFAVSLYGETAFTDLVALRAAGPEAGWDANSIRRGVLSRGEPAERRVWTFRARTGDVDVLFARAPESEEPWTGDLAERIARRLPELCERSLLYAPGAGNAALRKAAQAAGVTVTDDGSAAAVLAAFEGLQASQVSTAPSGGLAAALAADPIDEAELDTAVASFSRAYQAFRAARPALDGVAANAPARLAFLRSIDRVAPPHVRIPEGTTWAVQLASHGVDTGLLGPDSRFGGPGIEIVTAVAKAVADAGRNVERVQIGASKRERREDVVLAPLDAPFGGLWRMMVGDVELAILTDLTPEGRVAATRLLSDERPRVVVVSLDGDLLSWWRSTGGADPIGWTGEEGRDVVAALSSTGSSTVTA